MKIRFTPAISLWLVIFARLSSPSWAIPLPDNSSINTSSPALQITNTGSGISIYGFNSGTGRAGYFQILNPSNNAYALTAVSNGTGISQYNLMSGLGRALYVQTSNASNTNNTFTALTNGKGSAALYQITNAASTAPALLGITNGSGSAIKGVAGTGLAGEFTGNVKATGTLNAGVLKTAFNVEASGDVLELRANGERLYRLEKPAPDPFVGIAPNLIGGFSGNSVAAGIFGATIGGGGWAGSINQVGGYFGTVSGGQLNASMASNSTVAGGESNLASGPASTVSGGYQNTASGEGATASGGAVNTASGDYSFAAGRHANANHPGSFVWGDNTIAEVVSSGDNEVTFRASGGVRLFTNSALTSGLRLAPGGSQWLAISDRNMKNHFRTLDPKAVLEKFARMPITEWSYKAQDPSIRHIGPMAQDFYAAFGLGEDKLRIGTVDADGVMMAAIQGLNEKLKAEIKTKDQQITQLQNHNEEKDKKITEMEARLARLERLLTQGKKQ